MSKTTFSPVFHRRRVWVALLIFAVLPFVVSGQSDSVTESDYPNEMKGYKVQKDTNQIDLTELIELGKVKLGPLSLEQLNLEVPITVRPIKQEGEVDFMIFDRMTLNGLPFAVSEYNTPFKIPNESPITLPRNLEFHLTYSTVARTALAALIQADQPLRIQGKVLILGKFKWLMFLTTKRAVPVSFSFEQSNPLTDYVPLIRMTKEPPTAMIDRSPNRMLVSRPWYLQIDEAQETRLASEWAKEER